jgi:serine protease Do
MSFGSFCSFTSQITAINLACVQYVLHWLINLRKSYHWRFEFYDEPLQGCFGLVRGKMVRRSLISVSFLFCSPSLVVGQALDVIDQAGRYTVKITAAVDYPFGNERKGTWRGAGFLIDRDRGWILTNAHVAGKSPSKLRLSFKDRPYVSAHKVYVDNHLDLAIISVEAERIPADASIGALQCNTEPPAGAAVIAFGHPWSLDYTATRGIVSGTKPRSGEEKLQTDAAINPGNSGGPLIDVATGLILGINSSGIARSVSEGLNFAVPALLACKVVDLLKQGTDPAPPLLPVKFATTQKDRELVVADAVGAWSGALKAGDRVISVNSDQTARFASRFLSHARGASALDVEVQRGEGRVSLKLEVPDEKDRVTRLGVHVSGMVIGRSTVPGYDPTVMLVQFVDEASTADQASFLEGDHILSVNGKSVKSTEEMLTSFAAANGREVEVIIRRPRFTLITGRYDYFARTLDVSDVFEIDENGKR